LFLAIETLNREIQTTDHDFSSLRRSWKPFERLAAQREWEARNHRWCLLLLLENFRYAQSTLSRDRLFALLGLASDGNDPKFEPDYDSSLEEIVLRFAQVFVRQGRGIDLLYRAGLNRSDKFASWIPDWTTERPTALNNLEDTGVSFAASGAQAPNIRCIEGTDELSVEAYSIDAIESISTWANEEDQWGSSFGKLMR
jgi:hypothetical protein